MSSNSVEAPGHKATLYYAPLVLAVAVGFGQTHGLSVSILVVSAGALGAGIWLLWSSLQGLAETAPLTLEEAVSLGAPSAEEEQKQAVLRALKDLEYEKAVGKINDKDYEALTARYRKDALRLLQVVDKDLEPERQRAEKQLQERLESVRTSQSTEATPSKDEAEE